uniref:Uncharacterized protein n=1 Tax=Anopheles coluzzii TaxID=1518534 RepID=A0A8W7PZP0_ANOCL
MNVWQQKFLKRPADDIDSASDSYEPPVKLQHNGSENLTKFSVEIVQQLEFTTSAANSQPQQISTNVTVKALTNASVKSEGSTANGGSGGGIGGTGGGNGMPGQQQQQQPNNNPTPSPHMHDLGNIVDFKQEPENEFADLSAALEKDAAANEFSQYPGNEFMNSSVGSTGSPVSGNNPVGPGSLPLGGGVPGSGAGAAGPGQGPGSNSNNSNHNNSSNIHHMVRPEEYQTTGEVPYQDLCQVHAVLALDRASQQIKDQLVDPTFLEQVVPAARVEELVVVVVVVVEAVVEVVEEEVVVATLTQVVLAVMAAECHLGAEPLTQDRCREDRIQQCFR